VLGLACSGGKERRRGFWAAGRCVGEKEEWAAVSWARVSPFPYSFLFPFPLFLFLFPI